MQGAVPLLTSGLSLHPWQEAKIPMRGNLQAYCSVLELITELWHHRHSLRYPEV